MSLAEMIVRLATTDGDGEAQSWTVVRGSRTFLALRNARGDWEVIDLDASGDVLDVSGDLSGSLEYIESLFT